MLCISVNDCRFIEMGMQNTFSLQKKNTSRPIKFIWAPKFKFQSITPLKPEFHYIYGMWNARVESSPLMWGITCPTALKRYIPPAPRWITKLRFDRRFRKRGSTSSSLVIGYMSMTSPAIRCLGASKLKKSDVCRWRAHLVEFKLSSHQKHLSAFGWDFLITKNNNA